MPYFLDFLSRHEQSHLLLFWLEVGACVRRPRRPTIPKCPHPACLRSPCHQPFTYFTDHHPNQYNTEVFELAAGGGPSLVTQATRIHNSYLGADAPKRIDLPTGMQAFIQDEVAGGAPNINVFGAAHAWVYRRLKQTWYPAFLMSSTYQALLEHLKKVPTKQYGVPLVFLNDGGRRPSDVNLDLETYPSHTRTPKTQIPTVLHHPAAGPAGGRGAVSVPRGLPPQLRRALPARGHRERLPLEEGVH